VWTQHLFQQPRKLISGPRFQYYRYYSQAKMLPFLFLFLVCSCGFLVFILYFTSALDYTKTVLYQNKVRKAQKKIAEENMQKAVEVATEMAEVASSDGKAFCISHVDVGLDAAAVREAVLKVLERKVFSLFQLFTYNSLLPPFFFIQSWCVDRGFLLWFSALMKAQTRLWCVLVCQRSWTRERGWKYQSG